MGLSMAKVPLWLYWIGALVLYAIGEAVSKKWATDQSFRNGACAFVVYALSTTSWLGIMAHTNKLTLMSTLWEVGCILLAAVIGVLFYGERMTPTQWIGFVLAIVAGMLLVR